MKRYLFDLNKGELRDRNALRYGWDPEKLTSRCARGEKFNEADACHCPKGGYKHIRHNETRESFTNLLNVVCNYVKVVPSLQIL